MQLHASCQRCAGQAEHAMCVYVLSMLCVLWLQGLIIPELNPAAIRGEALKSLESVGSAGPMCH